MHCLTLPVVATVCLAAVACVDRELRPLTPCTIVGTGISVQQNPTNKVDLLFVVDNSLSMEDEQVELAAKLQRMIDVLSTGDLEPDDDQDVQSFTPVEDMHVGVLSTDMGGDGLCSELGDDGLLRTDPVGGTGCEASYPAFLTFGCNDAGECTPSQADLSADVSCMVRLGTVGCNNEQQLESVLKALSDPEAEDPVEFMKGQGHGGVNGGNAGFLRDNTVLAVILLTDEDDCSARDTDLYDLNETADNRYKTDGNGTYEFNVRLRCSSEASIGWGSEGADYPNGGFDGALTGALYPIERYVQGLLKLRASSPDLLVFAAITGVPEDLVDERDASGRLVFDYDEILADERMQAVVDPDSDDEPSEQRLKEACTPIRPPGFTSDDLRPPDPARRIVRLAQGLDAATGEQTSVLQSICEEDFTNALDAIIQRISDRLGNVCLPRELSRSSDGFVNCSVVETLPPEGTPDTIIEYTDEQLITRGRAFLRKENGRNVYKVLQLPTSASQCAVPDGSGWYYDDCSEDVLNACGGDGQRLRFKAGAESPPSSNVRLECLQPVKQVVAQNEGALGSPCQGEESQLCEAWPESRPDTDAPFLRCEPSSESCQYYCQSSADCPNSSFVCDTTREVCVNPTCNNI